MRLTSTMVCALLAGGMIAWAGCDNADTTTTGNDTNNTAPDARPAGERTTPADTGMTGATGTGTDTTTGTGTGAGTTGADTTGTSGTGMGTPTTSPSDTTGGTGAPR